MESGSLLLKFSQRRPSGLSGTHVFCKACQDPEAENERESLIPFTPALDETMAFLIL